MSPKSQDTSSTKKKKPTATKPSDMNAEVLEFITAIDDYKRKNNRPFPSWSEVLDVLKELGYAKLA